jgi:hypothetical protein
VFAVTTGAAVMVAVGVAILPRLNIVHWLQIVIVAFAAVGFLLHFVPGLIDVLLRKLNEPKKPRDD